MHELLSVVPCVAKLAQANAIVGLMGLTKHIFVRYLSVEDWDFVGSPIDPLVNVQGDFPCCSRQEKSILQ